MKVFVNESFTKALNDYTNSNEYPKGIIYNSFLVVVVRALICLYGELDIINPMMASDEELIKNNLTKFGYSKSDVEVFFSHLQLYYDRYKEDEKKKNSYFVLVQKELIDMLICKKLNFCLTDSETREFYDLLYTPNTSNPLRLTYNYLVAPDIYEVDNYFKKEMNENVKVVLPEEKHYLNIKAYEILNYSLDDLQGMSASDVDKVNTKVYDFFKIRENAINKEYLLEQAIDAYNKMNNKVTSGNGYVDILVVMSIICTALMVIGIIVFMII